MQEDAGGVAVGIDPIDPNAPERAFMDPVPASGPLLGSRRFTPLFLVQALGAFNDNVFKNAFIALLTYRLASDLEISLEVLAPIAAGVFILPFAIFSPFAGQISDSVDKAVMMRWVKFVEIILMIGAAVAYHMQQLIPLFILLFLMGAQSAFFAPIKYGVLPQYLPKRELVTGNGLIQAATFLSILLGTIVGTNLILTEAGILWTSIAVVAIAVIGWVSSLYALPAPPRDRSVAVDWTVVPAMAKVFAVTRAQPVAFRTIVAISWFWFAGATFMSLLAPFTKNQLGADETVLTLLLAGFSIGVAIGAMLCGVVYRGQIKVGYAPWAAVGIAIFSIDLMIATSAPPAQDAEALMNISDFLASGSGWRVLFDFVMLAACAGFYVTPLNAVYQNAAPEGERGRIVACSNMIDSALMATSAVVVALLVQVGLSTPQIFGLVGATGFIAAFFVARWAPETWIGQRALSFWPGSA